MKLSSKGHWALLAMVDVATNQGARPISLNEISARQNISVAYLEQLFKALRRRGLVSSVRGPKGGYRLARDAAAISAAEVVLAVDNSFRSDDAGGVRKCATRELWSRMQSHVLDCLIRTSLMQLAEGALPPAMESPGMSERINVPAEFAASMH